MSEGYAYRRYFTPSPLTASQETKNKRVRGARFPMSTPLTYQLLLDIQARDVQIKGLNQQTAANRATALRAFLRANHLSPQDVVGDEMRVKHADALTKYARSLEKAGTSARNITNSVSAIRPWKESVLQHDTVAALDAGKSTPFQLALKSSMEGIPVARVAREAKIPKYMLWGWIIGKVPRASSDRYLWRLESYLGLERNSLLKLSGIKPIGYKPSLGGEPEPLAYNQKLTILTKEHYFFKPEKTSPLRGQWEEFLHYKTATIPTLKRTRRGKWRFSPCPLTADSASTWWAFLAGREIASARMSWSNVARYLGWLMLPVEQGGRGLERDQLDTLAWLAVPDYIEEHLDWHRLRIGARNRGATQFLAFVTTLVRPVHGYLRQLPDMQQTLPQQFQDESWEVICDRQFELVQNLTYAYKDETEVTRDSFAPIRHIIHLPQPMEAIADMVHRMRADRPVAQPRREPIWARDMLLIRLLISNPLRLRSLAHLTWRADNSGELYQRPDRSWWIRIPKRKFKNTAGAAGDRDYDSQVHPSARQIIEQYLFVYRPKLLREPSDLVFLAGPSRQKGHESRGHEPWGDLSKRVYALTARYLPRCAGTGAHAFRHIVATSILKADGGDFKTAALVLNDRPYTVERHYAGLRSNDGSERMAKLLEGPLSRM